MAEVKQINTSLIDMHVYIVYATRFACIDLNNNRYHHVHNIKPIIHSHRQMVINKRNKNNNNNQIIEKERKESFL